MGETLVFHPAVVRSWGVAARGSGTDVRTARSRVTTATEDAAAARLAGLVSDHASDRYLSRVGKGVGQVADNVRGTGDRLVETVDVVRSADDASVDLFRHWGGPRP